MADYKQTLSSLASQVPGQIEQDASRAQSKTDLAIQQAVAATPAPALTTPRIQEVAAQAATQQGAEQVKSQEQGQQRLANLAKEGAQKAQHEIEMRIKDQKLGIAQKGRALQERLSSKNRELKDALFDNEMKFQQDELGRTAWNERQLLDWKVTQAKSQQELAEYEQEVQQMHEKRTTLLKTAQAKIKQALANGFDENEQKLNNAQTIRLTEAKLALDKKIAQEKAEKAASNALLVGAFTVLGTAVGAVVGFGAPGAMAGGAIGAGVGNMVAGSKS